MYIHIIYKIKYTCCCKGCSINSNCSEFAIAHYYSTSEGVLIATIALMLRCTMLTLCLLNFINNVFLFCIMFLLRYFAVQP